MKRIVCIIESLGQGGAERQIAYLAGLLKEAGENVELWTYYDNDFNKYILDEYGVRHRYVKEAQDKKSRVFVLKKLLNEYHAEVVISYLDSCSMTLCLTKLLGAKYKLIVSERSSTRILDRHAKLKYLLYRMADCVVANSYSEANAIKKFAPKLADKTTTIVNYTDTEKFQPQRNCSLNNTLRLLGVGRISGAKNLLCYADAVSVVRSKGFNVSVDWYGNTTYKKIREQLVERIHQLKIDNVFVLHPADNKIELIYPQYDAFCLPSIYEGFPNVICEAMSCGLPIICSNVCDNGYIVKDGENGVLFDPSTSQSIADGIIRYIKEMQTNIVDIGLKNRNKILELCSKKSFLDKYIKVIYQ